MTAVNQDGILHDVHISGDFFFFPAASLLDLEKALENTAADSESITGVVEELYKQQAIESPGVVPADFGQVLTV